MALHVYQSNRGQSAAQAMSAALVVWAFFYMTNAAMRTVAPSFAVGLAFSQFYLNKD
jgi:hypothetical protein